MKLKRFKQIGFAGLLALSLAVAAIANCACDHHQTEKVLENSSCHSHSDKSGNAPKNTGSIRDSIGADCLCLLAAPKVAVKHDTLKLKKAPVPAGTLVDSAERKIQPVLVIPAARRNRPIYLADSFYNIVPTRGPPTS